MNKHLFTMTLTLVAALSSCNSGSSSAKKIVATPKNQEQEEAQSNENFKGSCRNESYGLCVEYNGEFTLNCGTYQTSAERCPTTENTLGICRQKYNSNQYQTVTYYYKNSLIPYDKASIDMACSQANGEILK